MGRSAAKNKPETPQRLKVFLFHGLDLDCKVPQSVGDCPFCDKPQKFHVNSETGQWDCKVCGRTGNAVTFLQQLWEHASPDTNKLFDLASDRGIPAQTLSLWGIRPHPWDSGAYLIPAYNPEGKLANLYRITNVGEKWKVLSSPEMAHHPFGTHLLTKGQQTVWIMEGPWDGGAWYNFLTNHRRNGERIVRTSNPEQALIATEGVIAMPGASTFKDSWLRYTAGKNARFLNDNDHPRYICADCRKTYSIVLDSCPHCKSTEKKDRVSPPAGYEGIKRIAKVIASSNGQAPRSAEWLRWGPEGFDLSLNDGFDVRDVVASKRSEAYAYVRSRLSPITLPDTPAAQTIRTTPVVDPLPRNSFAQLCHDYDSVLYFPPTLRDALSVMLACVISTELEGDQLWLRVIGPPGSGKSTLAEAISASEYVFPISLQTGFHSGYGDKSADNSLIPLIDRKTVMQKDADTLLQSPAKDRILSELRDIYDGASRAMYRTGKRNTYEGLRSTFILCGTNELRKLNRAHLGERFVDVEVLASGESKSYIRRALSNTHRLITQRSNSPRHSGEGEITSTDNQESNGQSHAPRTPSTSYPPHDPLLLKRATAGYIAHLKNSLPSFPWPDFTPQTADQLESLGELIGYMRAEVSRDTEGLFRSAEVEVGTRPASQLAKLALCLCPVLQRSEIDTEILRIVCKVASDTIRGFHWDITRLLYLSQRDERERSPNRPPINTGLTTGQIEVTLRVGQTTAGRLLSNMREIGIVTKAEVSNKSGQRGRDLHLWRLTPHLYTLVHQSAILAHVPPSVPGLVGGDVARNRPANAPRIAHNRPQPKRRG